MYDTRHELRGVSPADTSGHGQGIPIVWREPHRNLITAGAERQARSSRTQRNALSLLAAILRSNIAASKPTPFPARYPTRAARSGVHPPFAIAEPPRNNFRAKVRFRILLKVPHCPGSSTGASFSGGEARRDIAAVPIAAQALEKPHPINAQSAGEARVHPDSSAARPKAASAAGAGRRSRYRVRASATGQRC
jgi:hypothetical protein